MAQAPSNPANPLPVETLDGESYMEMRSKRAGILSAESPQTGQEKSIHRQKSNINNTREKLEKMLQLMKDYQHDNSDGNQKNKFSTANKEARLEVVRSILIDLKRQDDYLMMAVDHN